MSTSQKCALIAHFVAFLLQFLIHSHRPHFNKIKKKMTRKFSGSLSKLFVHYGKSFSPLWEICIEKYFKLMKNYKTEQAMVMTMKFLTEWNFFIKNSNIKFSLFNCCPLFFLILNLYTQYLKFIMVTSWFYYHFKKFLSIMKFHDV